MVINLIVFNLKQLLDIWEKDNYFSQEIMQVCLCISQVKELKKLKLYFNNLEIAWSIKWR